MVKIKFIEQPPSYKLSKKSEYSCQYNHIGAKMIVIQST